MNGEIRAISFDVGGTLIKPWPSVGHVYAEVATQHGWPGLSPETLNGQFALAWRRLKNFRHTRAEWAHLVDATFRGVIDGSPSRAFFSALYQRFAEPDAWHVFEDAVPALEALAGRGLKLAVISNWDRRLVPLLRMLKLHHYFDPIVVSCHAQAAKPARRIFELAARRLRLAPESILHIGDSREMDFKGARAAGLQSLLLNRRAAQPRPREVRSLREVAELGYIR